MQLLCRMLLTQWKIRLLLSALLVLCSAAYILIYRTTASLPRSSTSSIENRNSGHGHHKRQDLLPNGLLVHGSHMIPRSHIVRGNHNPKEERIPYRKDSEGPGYPACLIGPGPGKGNKTYILMGERGMYHLETVKWVFDTEGFQETTDVSGHWDIAWATAFTFKYNYQIYRNLKMRELRPGNFAINMVPGIFRLTVKENLVARHRPYIPPAFTLPKQVNQLIQYMATNPDKMFVQKKKSHRGVKIVSSSEISQALNQTRVEQKKTFRDVFLQEFIHPPFLIGGYRFDIGVYVTITSVDPLRIYMFDKNFLLRRAAEKYYPLDPENSEQYVVFNHETTFGLFYHSPEFRDTFRGTMDCNNKDMLDHLIRQQAMDPDRMWTQIEDSIYDLFYTEREFMRRTYLKDLVPRRRSFEMFRMDFILDEKLTPFLLEVNKFPNTYNETHFPYKTRFNRNVLRSTLHLSGVFNSESEQAPDFDFDSQSGLPACREPNRCRDQCSHQPSPTLPEQNSAAGVHNSEEGVHNSKAGAQNFAAGVQNPEAGAQNSAAGVKNSTAGVQNSQDSAECRFCQTCLDAAQLEFLGQSLYEERNSPNHRRVYPRPAADQSEARIMKERLLIGQTDTGAKLNFDKMHQNDLDQHLWYLERCIQGGKCGG